MLRYFNETKTSSIFPPQSAYMPVGMNCALESFKKKFKGQNRFILCPIHARKKEVDYQLGCTGGTLTNEILVNAAVREVREELGLDLPWKKLDEVKSHSKGGFYLVNLTDGKPSTVGYKKTEGKSAHRRVGCVVHGTENEMKTYLESGHLHNWKNDDGIIGLCAVSLD
jgi:hypothetical protein